MIDSVFHGNLTFLTKLQLCEPYPGRIPFKTPTWLETE